jgi:hypothetical protein
MFSVVNISPNSYISQTFTLLRLIWVDSKDVLLICDFTEDYWPMTWL